MYLKMLEPIQLRRQTHLLCSNCGEPSEYYENNRCWNCENDYNRAEGSLLIPYGNVKVSQNINHNFFSKFYYIIKKMFANFYQK